MTGATTDARRAFLCAMIERVEPAIARYAAAEQSTRAAMNIRGTLEDRVREWRGELGRGGVFVAVVEEAPPVAPQAFAAITEQLGFIL